MKRLLMLSALLGILTMTESCGCHSTNNISSVNSSNTSSMTTSTSESISSIASTSSEVENSLEITSENDMSIDLV